MVKQIIIIIIIGRDPQTNTISVPPLYCKTQEPPLLKSALSNIYENQQMNPALELPSINKKKKKASRIKHISFCCVSLLLNRTQRQFRLKNLKSRVEGFSECGVECV